MRIIAGIYKGYSFKPFKGTHTRPTTDMAKEAVFSVLEGYGDIESARVLDLFAGTGNMSLEFLSRGAAEVLSIDHDTRNLKYMLTVKKELGIENWRIEKEDVVKFCRQHNDSYDLVFADPPYDWPGMHPLVQQVFDSEILNTGGLFIMEHPKTLSFNHPAFVMQRQYGISSFSFFQKQFKSDV